MLSQRSFFVTMPIRSRCMSERNLVVPSNIVKTNSIKGKKAVNNGAFRSECVISETAKVSLNSSKLSLNSSIILQPSCLQIKRFTTGRPNHNPLAKIPFSTKITKKKTLLDYVFMGEKGYLILIKLCFWGSNLPNRRMKIVRKKYTTLHKMNTTIS